MCWRACCATTFDREVAGLHVTRSQWTMIAVVARSPGATQRTIAEALEMSEASAGRLIDRLCADGLLERHERYDDRRARASISPRRQNPRPIRWKGDPTMALGGRPATSALRLLTSGASPRRVAVCALLVAACAVSQPRVSASTIVGSGTCQLIATSCEATGSSTKRWRGRPRSN